MEQNRYFLEKAEALKPRLLRREVGVQKTVQFRREDTAISAQTAPDYRGRTLARGDTLCLDFGAHLVGYVKLRFGYTGFHPDAPAWIRLKFAEQPCELFEDAAAYTGWISSGWIQQEQLHLDVLPCTLELPRRYAFRYLEIEVLAVSGRFQLTLEDAVCTSVTSAEEEKRIPFSGDGMDAELDRVACNTMRSCMQLVFEDGPKRDRRLWLGDLRLQALVNYETYRNYDLVKRCLYLFAGATLENGQVGGCLFIEPEIEVDEQRMFDYSLLFIPTLRDYYRATGDLQTLRELAPTGWHQLEVVKPCFREDLAQENEAMGWCFVDWTLDLSKQASAQGIYLYCLKAAMELALVLEEHERARAYEEDYARKREAAEMLWDETLELYVSDENRQLSWASQVWMTLGGAKHGGKALLENIRNHPEARPMVTPYMYHNYVDALMSAGCKEKALEVLREYWGGMLSRGADTFWELYNPANPSESPYGGTIVNSYCHAWSCAPAYFLRKYR